MVVNMSLFGEIIHPTSRVVDDDDEDDFPEVPMKLEWEGDVDVLEGCDTLLLADGRLSCAMIQHCLDKETKQETLKCSSVEGGIERRIKHTKVYVAPPLCIVLCDGRLPCSQHKEYILQLLTGIKRMVALTSKCLVEYRPAESEEAAAGPLLRGLSTRHCTDSIRCSYLPSPNVISGVCAAAMEVCEVSGVSAELYVCYTDTPLDASLDSDVGRCLYAALQSSLLSVTPRFPSTGKFNQEKGSGPVLTSNMYS